MDICIDWMKERAGAYDWYCLIKHVVYLICKTFMTCLSPLCKFYRCFMFPILQLYNGR